ncbi:MAG: nitroreductase family protein [Clostridiales bacterium]|nr:nitroreductase family protein [Candidatus Blautia equi]
MEFNELIQARRSCRNFKEEAVDAELLCNVIRDAQQAPSWKNSQTAKYYVANTEESIAKVREALPAFNQKSSENAALVITTFVRDVAGFTAGAADNELSNKWGAYDLGIANAYFCLAAKNAGLDTLIMGIRDAGILRKNFNIPKTEQIVAVIAVGYGEAAKAAGRRKDLAEIVTML